jgi:hypothetical protein
VERLGKVGRDAIAGTTNPAERGFSLPPRNLIPTSRRACPKPPDRPPGALPTVTARKDGAPPASTPAPETPGNDLTWRFSLIVEAVGRLRSRSCIIDGEAEGHSSFDRIRP